MIIVSDTSPINGLAIVGYLWLLQQVYKRVLIPSAVADELKRGGEDDSRIIDALSLDWIEVYQPRDYQLTETLQTEYNLTGENQKLLL